MNTRLKDTREEKGFSLQKLADLTGLSKSTLQRYETGTTKKIPIQAVNKIQTVLGISLTETRLQAEDEIDISNAFRRFIKDLTNNEALMFDGDALDEETRQLLIESLRNSIRVAKVISKRRNNIV